ncbi:MAG: three component ABC system middle component [Pseudobdellovibrionaceae bacterium]
MFPEERLILNSLLGSQLIWQSTKAYQETHMQKKGIPLPILFLILPLVFHEDTEALIKNMKTTTVLPQVTQHPTKAVDGKSIKGLDILLGLEERCIDYSGITWESINIALSAKFINKAQEKNENFLSFDAIKDLPKDIQPLSGTSSADMLKAAKRLGAWFSKQDIPSTLSILRVQI